MSTASAESTCDMILGDAPEEYSQPRQIKYSFELKNKRGEAVENADFWIYVPVARTATQWCKELHLSHPAELMTDGLGNQILRFHFERLEPYSITLIRVKADLLLADEAQPVPLLRTDSVFREPSEYIQSDQPEIRQAAKKLVSGSTLTTAKRTAEWVSGHIKESGYVQSRLGALYALKEAKGDCTEAADLFTALCRANGIPARICEGYFCPRDMIVLAHMYHDWSEFYDGKVWRLADPAMKQFDNAQTGYIAFRIPGGGENNPMGRNLRYQINVDGLDVKMN